MKKILFATIATALAFTACSTDDFETGAGNQAGNITFNLSVDGENAVESKATTTNFRTSFEVGDVAGLYIVKNGATVKENVKLIYNSDGYWTASEDIDYDSYADATFYAYYPYTMSDLEFDTSLDDPFQTYIDNFAPQADQSTDANYEYSDLMTSTGATADANDHTVSVNLKHDMSLVCMELPNRCYIFSNEGLSNYVLSEATDAAFIMGSATIVPLVDDKTQQYRYLVNPAAAQDISITYTDNGTAKSATVTGIADIGAGNYHVEKVDGGVSLTPWTLQVGDFYMNDGTLLAKGTTLTNDQKENVLGIVYKVGTSAPVTLHNSKWSHGMVVGLTRTQNTWAPAINADDPTTTALTSEQNNAGWKTWYTNFNLTHLISNNASADKIIIDELEETGYRNSVNWYAVPDIISKANASKITDNSQKNFTTVYKSVYEAQQTNVPTPASLCSTWYVPSLAAWMDMKNSDLTSLEASISAAGGTALGIASKLSVPYWSSNLRGHETIWGFQADGTASNTLFTSLDMRKNSRYYRWVLAF